MYTIDQHISYKCCLEIHAHFRFVLVVQVDIINHSSYLVSTIVFTKMDRLCM